MKKVLFAVLATAALASCTQSDIINESDSSKKAISFDESYIGKTTRAVPVAGAKFAEGATIGVFSTGATADADNFKNQMVEYNAGAWIYSPQKFYESGKTYEFNAYAPYDSSVTDIDALYTAYTVSTDVATQKDLMYAPEVSSTGWNGTDVGVAITPIQFIFKHALTQVKVSARTIADYSSKFDLNITGLRINGINSVGTLTRGTDAWSDLGTPEEYTMGAIAMELNQDMQLVTTSGSDIFMLIPQSFTSDVTVELDIDVQFANGHSDTNVTEGKHTITAKIPATVEKPVEWGRNKVYNYQLNLILDKILNMQPIIFDKIEIEDWAAEEEIPSTETPEPNPIP